MTRSVPKSTWLLVLFVATSALTALAGPKPRTRGSAAAISPHGASVTDALECSACHSQASWDVSSGAAARSDFDHATTGFPLTGRHRVADCGDCHRSDRAIARQCVGCHEDAHQRTLGQACDQCHSAVSWSSVSGIALHRSTRLPLNGMHALAACSECHVRASDNVWRGVPTDCFACHAGDYNRQDIHPLHRGIPGDPTKPALPKNCAGCHRTTSFSPAFGPQPFRFRSSTEALRTTSHDRVFPLSFGKHRRAACADCHVSETAPRVVVCTGCHAHERSRLATQHRHVGQVGAGCLHCHPGGSRR
jgi:hypothetical protein